MGGEKEGSKSGGSYTGGFFQLFDWTGKSRKKLFSSKSDAPDRSKQARKGNDNIPMMQIHLMDTEEFEGGSSVRGSSSYSCASSVTDDEVCVTKAPGVVARLMGLDSMPTSGFSDTYSSPFFTSQSLRDCPHQHENFNYYRGHQHIYSRSLPNKAEGPALNNFESRPQKMVSRPIEKFQTEMLPPKSAKSIPITHHKLLSPIKNPGFVPTKNAALIMEAAAKIIEPGPPVSVKPKVPAIGSSSLSFKVQAPKEKGTPQKLPLVSSSSVTLKVKDLKQKEEATHKLSRLAESPRRPDESIASRYLKGQSMNKSWNGSVDGSFRASSDTDYGSCGSNNKGKSISLAIQAKVNVQRREGLSLNGSRTLPGETRQIEVKPSQPLKSKPVTVKSSHKKSYSHNSSGVLKQNNQKQNSLIGRDRLSPKSSISDLKGKKPCTRDPSVGNQRISGRAVGNSKTGVRKSSIEVTNGEKEDLYCSTGDFPRKKRSIERDFHFDKNLVTDKRLNEKSQIPIHPTTIFERPYNWPDGCRKDGADVVSFTFTAPLARPIPGSEISNQTENKSTGVSPENNKGKRAFLRLDGMKLSSVGYNVVGGGDALGAFLERKLLELTEVKSSGHDSINVGLASSCTSIFGELSSNPDAAVLMPRSYEKNNSDVLANDKLLSRGQFDHSTADSHIFRFKHKGVAVETDECCSSFVDSGPSLRHPSPVSILQSSFSESCDSSASTDSNSTEGSKLCSSVQAQEVVGLNSSKYRSVEGDLELSDSASSMSAGSLLRKHPTTPSVKDHGQSINWEIDYIKETIYHAEMRFEDFALGEMCEIIDPNLFSQLESRKTFSGSRVQSKLRRKVVFDCASECLDLRCTQYACGGYKMWEKGQGMLGRKDWLAEALYKDISSWEGMRHCMVDELVDNDMSSQYGRWLDFEADTFMLGVEIEGHILSTLVDELMTDITRL